MSRLVLGLAFLLVAVGLAGLLAACGTEETTSTAAPAQTTAAPTETTSASMETLKIGAILSLTDWYSVVDAAEKVDMELVAQMINDDGGIQVQGKSYKIELVIEDGKSTLDGNAAAATKLVLDDKLQFVVGPGAFFNLATTPIFEENKVLHVANYNGLNPAEMNADTPYEFLGLDPIAQQSAALKALKEYYSDVKTVCLASEDATFPAFETHFLALVDRMSLSLAGDPVLFATNAEDYNPVASAIMAQNPDAVWIPVGIDPSYAGIIKGLRTLGYEGPIVLSMDAPQMVNLVGPEAATGLVGLLSKQLVDPNIAPPMKRLLEMGDSTRNIFGLGPNALYMLAYAIEAADSLDPTEVAKNWEALTSIPTLYGDGFPTGEELYGLRGHAWAYPCPVCLINDGQIEYKPWIVPDATP